MGPSATMQFKVLVLLFAILLSVTGSCTALGINCRGSSNCDFQSSHTMSEINTGVQGLNGGNVYGNGQHIYCVGNVCAFLQNISGTKTVSQIQGYVQDLLNHGCNVCGSDPTEPGNNVNSGELTVNWVSNP